MRVVLSQERLRELLSYEPSTGMFTWRVSRGGRAKHGSLAGALNQLGYRQIRVDGKAYSASHLAWLYVTGAFPAAELDHRDLLRDNNAFDNLRPATRLQNIANRKAQKNNKLGVKGVSCRRGRTTERFSATIGSRKNRKFLGYFSTPEEAANAYAVAAEQRFGSFARHS